MEVCKVETSAVFSTSGTQAIAAEPRIPGKIRRYELVSVLFALVLLVAAVLKGRLLLSQDAQILSTAKRVMDTASASIELLLGVWLLSGLARVWARFASLTLLAVFTVVASYHLVYGSTDCGCLGQVTVHPGIILLFDILVALALLRWGPDPFPPVGERWRTGIAISAGSLCLCVLGIMAQPVQTGIVATPAIQDLGTVQPGPLIHKITLTNRTLHPVHFNKVIAGCGCTTVSLAAKQLAPGESAVATCNIDLTGRSGEFATFVQFLCREEGVESKEQVIRCMIRGDVDSVLKLDASELTFKYDEPATFVVRIKSKQPDVQITNVQFTHSAFRAKIANDLTFRLNFNPGLWHDREGRVTMFVETTCEAQRRIIVSLPVTATGAK